MIRQEPWSLSSLQKHLRNSLMFLTRARASQVAEYPVCAEMSSLFLSPDPQEPGSFLDTCVTTQLRESCQHRKGSSTVAIRSTNINGTCSKNKQPKSWLCKEGVPYAYHSSRYHRSPHSPCIGSIDVKVDLQPPAAAGMGNDQRQTHKSGL